MNKVKKNKIILFVVNPISGGQDKNILINTIRHHAEAEGIDAFIYQTTGQHDRESIAGLIEEKKPEKVVAVGGDGTISLVARCLMVTSIPLGIVPAGSANGMALDLNIPQNTERALEVIFRGKPKTIDMVRINGQHYSLHLSDIGLNARIVKRFDREKTRGLFSYARQAMKEIRKRKAERYIIESGGEKHKAKAHMVVIANARYYGTGAIINPKGRHDDGRFEIVVIKPYPFYVFLPLMWNFFTGHLDRMKNISTYTTDRATVHCHKPQELQIDGEPMGEQRQVNAEIVPSALRVLLSP